MNIFQVEADLYQYIFCFVLMNLIFITTYLSREKNKIQRLSWGLCWFFCIFAFWDTDYFTFQRLYYYGLENFRDPFYYYLSFISFNSYLIFRLIIWGGALLFYKLSCKRIGLSLNTSIFVFSIFFLLTFSYARASLGMSAYFYGLVLYLTATNKKKVFIKVALMFLLSFFAHRSMALLILLTPIIKFRLSKKSMLLIVVLIPSIVIVFNNLFSSFVNGELFSLGSGFEGVTEAAQKYSALDVVVEKNWKFQLTSNLRNISFYILGVYLSWGYYFSKCRKKVLRIEQELFNVVFIMLLFALSMQTNSHLGLSIIGYRYLYTLGIPLCLLLSSAIQNGWCKYKIYILLLLPAFLYSEGFLFGKILSLI